MVKLTTGEKIARDLCEMDATIGNAIEVDPVDVARRIDEAMLELSQHLAAEQLNNKRLREALESIAKRRENLSHLDNPTEFAISQARNFVISDIHGIANKALALPRDTSALDAYVAEKVKAIEAERDYHMSNAKHVYEQCSKITKQRDLAVEALEKTRGALAYVKANGRDNPNLMESTAWHGLAAADKALATIKESEAMAQGEKP